ncbi:unknown [Clostridium sp. CAG:967]|nr:unknown [Clostridium sp. CAG:967]
MANEVSKIYNDIAELLNVARAMAYHSINSIMVETYWKIGNVLLKKNRVELLVSF